MNALLKFVFCSLTLCPATTHLACVEFVSEELQETVKIKRVKGEIDTENVNHNFRN